METHNETKSSNRERQSTKAELLEQLLRGVTVQLRTPLQMLDQLGIVRAHDGQPVKLHERAHSSASA